jgi:hypothetical protein
VKIVDDTPGHRLKLTGEGTTVPRELLFVVIGMGLPVVLLPFGILWYLLSRGSVEIEPVLGAAFVCTGMVVGIYKAWDGTRSFPALFEVDRDAGQARLGHMAVFGGDLEEEVLALDAVERVTVERLTPPDERKRADPALTIRFELLRAGLEARIASMTIVVDGLDRSEEVVDFAFRLAAAAGLPTPRVVRNDPRAIVVELTRDAQPAAVAVPLETPRADFARDEAAPVAQAAVAQEVVEAFRPEVLDGEETVTVWKPGVEVVIERAADSGLSPFGVPFLLLGPGVYFLMKNSERTTYTDLLTFTATAGLFGLILGGRSLFGVLTAKKRTVRFDWGSRTLSIRDGSRTREIPMASLTAVELKCHHEHQGGRSSGTGAHSGSLPVDYFHCIVHLHWREAGAEPESMALVETSVSEEADGPYRQTLPLATELARALHVERRLIDYDSRRPA